MRSSYAARAVARAVACGARCIEHGNYLDDDTAVANTAAGAFMLHSLVAHAALREGEGMRPCWPRQLEESAVGYCPAWSL